MPKKLLWFVLILLLTGCSSFQRAWQQAAKVPSVGIQGCWEGTWQSDSSRHAGRLRCLLTQIDGAKYEARFHANYRKILSFGYTASLTGQHTNEIFTFAGTADLGPLAGGVYHYAGRISSTNFFSTYQSKHDNGIFQMQRLP